MKKLYSKPDIVFDSFSLCTNITAGCEVKTNMPSNDLCGYKFGALYVFINGIQGCTTPIVDGSIVVDSTTNDALCYHNPSENSNLFNS